MYGPFDINNKFIHRTFDTSNIIGQIVKIYAKLWRIGDVDPSDYFFFNTIQNSIETQKYIKYTISPITKRTFFKKK